ncbi:MAG: hypothetical protein WDL87_09130 [Candidatus Omnitrophota bacterium]|jgi:hypothetical protein
MRVQFNYDKVILAFIDILGYKELIQDRSAEEVYGLIYEALKPKYQVSKDPDHPAQKYANEIKVQVLSDSIIMFIDETKVRTIGPIFLHYLCEFCLKFIANTGFLLRGGIASGNYFQEQLTSPKNQFIFSKALIAAYQLEQEASYPRILFSDNLLTSGGVFNDYAVRDFDGLRILDIYKDSVHYPQNYREYIFHQIIQSLGKVKSLDRGVLKKQFYFKQYHNKKVEEIIKSGVDNFLFDLKK